MITAAGRFDSAADQAAAGETTPNPQTTQEAPRIHDVHTRDTMKVEFDTPEDIESRYTILVQKRPRRGQRTVFYEAEDTETGEKVCIKCFERVVGFLHPEDSRQRLCEVRRTPT